MHFPGILPAVITPFDAYEQIDFAAFDENLACLLEHGVAGVVVNGTMGEAASLTDGERREILSRCVETVGDRGPVVAGVSGASTAVAVRHATIAAECGAAGVMCLPPLNYDGRLDEFVAFYRRVAEAGLPVMAYNNPEASGVDLPLAAVAEIAAQVAGVVAIKECSADARRIAALRNATRLEVLVGGDDWALEGFAAGASGWVSGVANVVPAECVELHALVGAGRMAEARDLYARLLPLARLDMTPHLVQFFKAAMDARGLKGGPCRAPRLGLTGEQAATLQAALGALEPALTA